MLKQSKGVPIKPGSKASTDCEGSVGSSPFSCGLLKAERLCIRLPLPELGNSCWRRNTLDVSNFSFLLLCYIEKYVAP